MHYSNSHIEDKEKGTRTMIFRTQATSFVWCLISVLGMDAASQNADSMTLGAVIDLAVKNSAPLNARLKGVAAAKARTNQSRSAYYPNVNGIASYMNIGPVPNLNFRLAEGITTDPATGQDKLSFATAPFQLFPANNWDFHVGADYVLYDFGKRKKTVTLSSVGEEAANLGTEFSSKIVAYQAVVLFESLVNGEQMVQAKNEDISNLQHHLDYVKKKLSTGSATQFDVLRSEVQLSNSQTEATNLDNNRIKQQIDLRQFLGLSENAPIFLKGTFDSTHEEYSRDSLVMAALKGSSEIDLMKTFIKSLEAQLALGRLELLPSLSAHVSAGAKNGYVPDLNQIELNWVVGGQLQVPIIDGRRNHYHELELQARIDSTRIILKDNEDRTRTEVLKAIQDVKSAYQNFVAAKTNVKLAGESRRIANLQYEAGAIPNLDLLDAEDKFIQAKFAQLTSEYRYTLSRYALMQVTGFDFAELSGSAAKK
jgi:outer membrane protein